MKAFSPSENSIARNLTVFGITSSDIIVTLKGNKEGAYIILLATREKVVFKNIYAFCICFVTDIQPEDWHVTRGNQ